MAWLEFLHAWKRCFSKDWMKSFNNLYGSLGILCLSNVLGFKLDMKVNSLGCTLFAQPWRFLETLWSPSDHSWIGAGNRWILQDALSYFYATNSGNPSNSSFWPNEQLDAIINLFKGFLNKEREFLLIKLQLCTVRVIHTLDFYSNQLLYFSIQIEYGKFWSSGWFYV
jgi:hypothetical protein